MELTASKTASCTIAPYRAWANGFWPFAMAVLTAISFQSRTASAFADGRAEQQSRRQHAQAKSPLPCATMHPLHCASSQFSMPSIRCDFAFDFSFFGDRIFAPGAEFRIRTPCRAAWFHWITTLELRFCAKTVVGLATEIRDATTSARGLDDANVVAFAGSLQKRLQSFGLAVQESSLRQFPYSDPQLNASKSTVPLPIRA